MLLKLQQIIKNEIHNAIMKAFEIEIDTKDLVIEYPPKTELGDLAFPVAFDLAKRLKASTGAKQNPRQLAEKVKAEMLIDGVAIDGVARIEIAGAGYLNIFFDRGHYLQSLANDTLALDEITGGKLIVEHTSINPNKAAHIGHVRNAVLGDTIVRMLRASGENVEVHNYIDNTGVQVADVVVGFKYIEKRSLDEIKAISEQFDYYCWDLYARVGKFYEEDKENLKLRAQTLHEIEHNIGDTASIAEYVSSRILKCHLDTMWRLGISYEVLPRESDILHLNFWATAFEKLKEQDAIYFETEGRSKGCWVMRGDQKAGEEKANEEQPAQETQEEESQYEADKIIVRSNGTVTYTGKDIAYHLWKLGQLGLDFSYRNFYQYPTGLTTWITTSEKVAAQDHAVFGNGVAYFNVIDVGQSYTQAYVKLGVKLLSTDDRIDRSAHLAYEKVVLTPASAKELGYELSEAESKRSQISMSGRKGLGVKADDLINKLEEKAHEKVQEQIDKGKLIATPEEHKQIAHLIAVSALRYFLLKYTRNSIIAFDFEEALAFEGEAGPYTQYASVRVSSIFRRLIEKSPNGEADVKALMNQPLTSEDSNRLLSLKDEETGWNGEYLWSIIYQASRLKDILKLSVQTLEPTHVAKFAHKIASNINEFYNNKAYRIVDIKDQERQRMLLHIATFMQKQLTAATSLLGIEIPDKM